MKEQTRASYFETMLYANGWDPCEKVCLVIPLWRWVLELTEKRYISPYTGKRHRLAKALKKEKQMQQVTETLFI